MGGQRFTVEQDGYISKLYRNGGPDAVMKHVDKPRAAIIQRAHRMGIPCDREKAIKRVVTDNPVPLPGMTAEDVAACVELRAWHGYADRSRMLMGCVA